MINVFGRAGCVYSLSYVAEVSTFPRRYWHGVSASLRNAEVMENELIGIDQISNTSWILLICIILRARSRDLSNTVHTYL